MIWHDIMFPMMHSSMPQTFSDHASLMSCHMTEEKVTSDADTQSDNEHLTSQSLTTKLHSELRLSYYAPTLL